MGNGIKLVTGEIATTTNLKTIAQIVAAANHAIRVHEWSVSFQGSDPAGTPIRIDVLRQTTAGTMSTQNPVKDPDDFAETVQTTGLESATAEPTAGDVIDSLFVHPNGGGYTWQAPHGREIKVGGGDRLGIRVLAAVDVDCVVTIKGEE